MEHIVKMIDDVLKDPSKQGEYLGRHIRNEIERNGYVFMPLHVVQQMNKQIDRSTEQLEESTIRMEKAVYIIDAMAAEIEQLNMERAARYN